MGIAWFVVGVSITTVVIALGLGGATADAIDGKQPVGAIIGVFLFLFVIGYGVTALQQLKRYNEIELENITLKEVCVKNGLATYVVDCSNATFELLVEKKGNL